MSTRSKLIPLIVASPVFLQNIDATAITTALPSMAASLGVPPLSLNLVISSYLLSMAVFLPISAWLSDRFGPKQVFCLAISLFSLASALCGMTTSVPALVASRIFQGLGAALMVPVGRLILLRTVPPSQMIVAMIWYTVPPVIGRLAGPMVGGAIVSVTSWHWIFFVNIPFGVVAVVLTLLLVDDIKVEGPTPPLDAVGFLLMAVGLAATLGALETAGKGLASAWVSGLAAAVGVTALFLYGLHCLKQSDPVIDVRILRLQTFRTNILGGIPLRLALSAAPFLLPLMLQLGFGVSPLVSGMLSASSALGALCTRGVMRWAISRYGFQRLLLGANVLTGLCYSSYALFSPVTSQLLMYCALFVGGLLSSLCMVSLNTLGFVDVPKQRMSHATAMTAMAQQLTAGVGVVLTASLLAFFPWWRNGSGHQPIWQDFAASFLVVGMTTLLSLPFFVKLKPHAGREWL